MSGLRGRTNTVLQTCFFAHLRRAAARRGDRADQGGDPQDLRPQGRGRGAPNFAAVDDTLARLFEVHRAGRAPPARWERPPIVPADAPDFVRRVTALMMEGRGDEIPVSADAGRRHLPVRHRGLGEAQHRRSGAGLGTGPVHPMRPMQLRLPAQRDPREILRRGRAGRRAGRLQVGADQRARLPRRALHACNSRSRTAPAAACASKPARRSARASPDTKAINLRDKLPLLEAGTRQHRLLRDAAGERPRPGRFRQCARRAVPGAAVRVLRRLRRLRRDAVSEAAVAIVRRPRCRSPTPPAAPRSMAATCR